MGKMRDDLAFLERDALQKPPVIFPSEPLEGIIGVYRYKDDP